MNHESNELVQARLARAILAVKQLDRLGCVVGRVEVGSRPPIIHITSGKGILHGAFRTRVTVGQAYVYSCVAVIEGCQVQWQEDAQQFRAADPLHHEFPPVIGERMRDAALDIARNGADA